MVIKKKGSRTCEAVSERKQQGARNACNSYRQDAFTTCSEQLVNHQVVGEIIGLPSAELPAFASISSIVQRLGMRAV